MDSVVIMRPLFKLDFKDVAIFIFLYPSYFDRVGIVGFKLYFFQVCCFWIGNYTLFLGVYRTVSKS